MHLQIHHQTIYAYDRPVNYSIQSLRLSPHSFSGQSVLRWRVSSYERMATSSGEDAFGNLMTTLTTTGDHSFVTIQAIGEVMTTDNNGVVSGAPEPFRPMFFLRQSPMTKADEAIIDLAKSVQGKTNGVLELGHGLMAAIRDSVEYETGSTETEVTAAESFAQGAGVCQDHAHILIAAARSIGVPARYVSGYLWSGEATGPFDASHAWAELFVADLGWVGFDVANRTCPTDAHVRVATGLDYLSAAPIRGLRYGDAGEKLEVTVEVTQQ